MKLKPPVTSHVQSALFTTATHSVAQFIGVSKGHIHYDLS
jgi:hypothetical protein